MTVAIEVNPGAMPSLQGREASLSAVPKKTTEDHEIEARVCGHIRREMVERGLGVNATGRRLGLGGGTLSKILNGERGFKAGFLLRLQRAFRLPAKMLLEEDPPSEFMRPGVPEVPEESPAPRRRRDS